MFPWLDTYRSMLTRISSYGSPRVADADQLPTGPGPHLALLAEAPANDECDAYVSGLNLDTHGSVLVGPSGVVLEAALQFTGFPRNRCYISNVFPFEIHKDYTIKMSDVDEVSSYVRNKFKDFSVIVCLGRPAWRVFSDRPDSLLDIAGAAFDIDGQKVIPTIHPAYSLKTMVGDAEGDESVFWYLVLALRNAAGLLNGEQVYASSENQRSTLLTSPEVVREWLGDQPAGTVNSLDFEATSTNPYLSGLPSCASMCHDGVNTISIAFAPWFPFSTITFYDFLRIMEEMTHIKYGQHNLLYDYSLMTRFGYTGPPPYVDTMYLAHTGIEFMPKSLKFLSAFFCKVKPYSFPFNNIEPFYRGAPYEDYEYWLVQLLHYAGTDAMATRQLIDTLPIVFGNDWLRIEKSYNDYVHPLLLNLHRMTQSGIILNQSVLQIVRQALMEERKESERDFKIYFPNVTNMKSPKEIGAALTPVIRDYFPSLGQKTKKGNVSINKTVLLGLADKGVKSAAALLSYRKVDKRLSTYINAYPNFLDSEGLIHTQFGIAKTGRLKSSDPALQTLPRKSVVLSLFTADHGTPPYDLIDIKADFSAAEARLLAFYCGIESMLDPTVDVHKLSAMHFYEVALEEVTPEMRQATKNLTFGVIYGAAARRVAVLVYGNDSPDNIEKAQKLLDLFFERFPPIKAYMSSREWDVRNKGYVEMSKGLRRHFPVECMIYRLTDPNNTTSVWGMRGKRLGLQLLQKAIREGYNFGPQGGVAYLTNTALMNCNEKFDAYDWGDRTPPELSLQVHDALVVQAHKSVFTETLQLMQDVMVAPIMGDVIIPVEFSIGWDLLNQKEVISASESVNVIDWEKIESKLTKQEDLLQFVKEARNG